MSENEQKPNPRDTETINSKITNGEVKLTNHRPAKTEKKTDKKEPAKKKQKEKKVSKVSEKAELKALEFPVSAYINDYGFVNFRKRLLDALGWAKGQKLTIERNDDGSITVYKA